MTAGSHKAARGFDLTPEKPYAVPEQHDPLHNNSMAPSLAFKPLAMVCVRLVEVSASITRQSSFSDTKKMVFIKKNHVIMLQCVLSKN